MQFNAVGERSHARPLARLAIIMCAPFSIFKLEPACPPGAFVSALKRPCWPLQLAGDELLPPVDVVGRTREGRVGHDVYGERGDVGGSY